MKMSASLFSELKSDCLTIAAHADRGGFCVNNVSDAWQVFHAVCFDRMQDDSHPAFANNVRTRVLPFWSRNGESKDMQGNDHWLNRFYDEENLNDDHIATALRKIFNLTRA